MKQTDKCECGHKRIYHYKAFSGKEICAECKNHHEFKSYSQDTTQTLEVSSSVPYLPLTKERHRLYRDDVHGIVYGYREHAILSALNGLREEIFNSWIHERYELEELYNKINKWFPIGEQK